MILQQQAFKESGKPLLKIKKNSKRLHDSQKDNS